MEKIDRLGWAAGISFKAYGVKVGLRVSEPDALDRLLDHLPYGWEPAATPTVERLYSLVVGGVGRRSNVRRFNLLYGNLDRLARTRNLDEALEVFQSNLQLYLAEEARRRVFVHAGVVGWHGRAIVIPGRSFSGKTTLVAELVRAGATYYSDEYAVFDSRGRAHPYPKPLSLREDGSDRQKNYTVDEIGGRPGVKPLPVGLLIVSEYKRGARWRPQQVSAGQGGLALLANTVSARRQPETVLTTLKSVLSQAVVLKGARGEAVDMANSILKHLDDRLTASSQ